MPTNGARTPRHSTSGIGRHRPPPRTTISRSRAMSAPAPTASAIALPEPRRRIAIAGSGLPAPRQASPINVNPMTTVPSPPPSTTRSSPRPTSAAFTDLRRAEAEDAGKPFKLQWRWRPLGKISRYLRAAVVYAEDYNFYTHDGVDWDAIENAVERDLGGARIGGSTITQQLAKNLYLSPNRSMLRKMREMLIAFALEDHLSKQRILEL